MTARRAVAIVDRRTIGESLVQKNVGSFRMCTHPHWARFREHRWHQSSRLCSLTKRHCWRDPQFVTPFRSLDVLRTLLLPDDMTRKVEAQAIGTTRVNDIVLDCISSDRLIAYATDFTASIRCIDHTNERHGETTIVDATPHTQTKFTLQ
jgi:hypothetical protein